MKNGDFIRSLDDDRMTRFLWTWSINTVSNFMRTGGEDVMDIEQIRSWLNSRDFVCEQTIVEEDLIYDQDFNMRTANHDRN